MLLKVNKIDNMDEMVFSTPEDVKEQHEVIGDAARTSELLETHCSYSFRIFTPDGKDTIALYIYYKHLKIEQVK